MIKFQFNTSRLYTAEGQVIVVAYDPTTGVADFNDVSRMIYKRVTVQSGLTVLRDIADQVMHEYDHGHGEYTFTDAAPKRDRDDIVYLYRI